MDAGPHRPSMTRRYTGIFQESNHPRLYAGNQTSSYATDSGNAALFLRFAGKITQNTKENIKGSLTVSFSRIVLSDLYPDNPLPPAAIRERRGFLTLIINVRMS
jgi:hypothetical protein